MTETNAEQLNRLNPSRQWRADNNRIWGVREHDYKFLIEQAEMNIEGEGGFFGRLAAKKCKENKRLREALEFYASEYAWKESVHETVEGDRYPDAPPIIHDGGEKARQALETSP